VSNRFRVGLFYRTMRERCPGGADGECQNPKAKSQRANPGNRVTNPYCRALARPRLSAWHNFSGSGLFGRRSDHQWADIPLVVKLGRRVRTPLSVSTMAWPGPIVRTTQSLTFPPSPTTTDLPLSGKMKIARLPNDPVRIPASRTVALADPTSATDRTGRLSPRNSGRSSAVVTHDPRGSSGPDATPAWLVGVWCAGDGSGTVVAAGDNSKAMIPDKAVARAARVSMGLIAQPPVLHLSGMQICRRRHQMYPVPC
jgi:hypothetical protein